jgi:hypothetical protein
MSLTKVHNRMVKNAPANIKDFGAVGDGSGKFLMLSGTYITAA